MPERSKKLGRQLKRTLGNDDIETIAGGFLSSIRNNPDFIAYGIVIDALLQLPTFIDAVDKSYAEYEDRLKMSERNIAISSQELNQTFRNLEKLSGSVNAMIDSLEQGFLFFDERGICADVYSRPAVEILGKVPAWHSFPDLIELTGQQRADFDLWLTITFSGTSALEFDELKKLLPDSFINPRGKEIGLDYRPMYLNQGSLFGILLIATDLTQQKQQEKEIADIKINAQKIAAISGSRNEFYQYIANFRTFLDGCGDIDFRTLSEAAEISLIRELHTYKGMAAVFSLVEIGQKIHEIESLMMEKGDFAGDFFKRLGELRALVDDEVTRARKIFGDNFMTRGAVITMDREKIVHLMDSLSGAAPGGDPVRYIKENILAVPIFDMFATFERELGRIADMQGKYPPEMVYSGKNILVMPENYGDFFAAAIHVARNIVDHGIEMPNQRTAMGKHAEGRVTVDVQKAEGAAVMTLRIGDDGQGIDPQVVRQKLERIRGKSFAGESDQEIIQHIFDADFSSKGHATLISGRGLGMSALQDEVTRMGGTVKVESIPHGVRGTVFTINLPYIL